MYGQLIFDKGVNTIHWKIKALSTNVAKTVAYPYKNVNYISHFSLYAEIDSYCIAHLNVKSNTIKTLGGKCVRPWTR